MKKNMPLVVALILFAVSGAGYAAGTNYYVWRNNPSPTSPFTNWDMAATSIQDAVNLTLTLNNDVIYVTNGVYDTGGAVVPGYALTNRVMINKIITLTSMNGPTNTIIKGKPDDITGACGDTAVRCVYISGANSFMSGFTLTNGYTMTNGNATYDRSGGGLLLITSSAASNLVITGNTADYSGGGVYASASKLYDSTISSNTANGWVVSSYEGGGGGGYAVGASSLSNCTFINNSATSYAGGLYLTGSSRADYCRLINNKCIKKAGGGIVIMSGEANYCTMISNNAVNGQGAGAWLQNTVYLRNSLVMRNGSTAPAVGMYLGANLLNCTVVSNLNYWAVQDHNWSTTHPTNKVINCIVWNPGNISTNISMIVNYTCFSPMQVGEGNIGTNPRFVDADASNYRLMCDSPCLNTGTNASWTTNSVDLDGRIRIRYGRVDMGCYETIYEGSIYTVY